MPARSGCWGFRGWKIEQREPLKALSAWAAGILHLDRAWWKNLTAYEGRFLNGDRGSDPVGIGGKTSESRDGKGRNTLNKYP